MPKRLLVRPTDHSGIEAPGKDIDYWLKGKDNGIMKEPPITYNLQRAGTTGSLMTAQSWRLPSEAAASDSYTVDYSTSTGKKPHWSSVAMAHEYPDMRSNDARCLAYNTAPIESVVRIVRHPIVQLWLTTAAPDLDVFAYLEAVDRRGHSTYVTQGSLRASHRKLSTAPFGNFGLPWRDQFQSKLEPIPADTPFELVFDLLPTAYELTSGQRIRISIAGADSGNFDTPCCRPPPACG